MIVAGELHKLISVRSMSIATLNAVSVVSCVIYKMIVHKGFIEIPTRCILFIYLSALHVSGYAHL